MICLEIKRCKVLSITMKYRNMVLQTGKKSFRYIYGNTNTHLQTKKKRFLRTFLDLASGKICLSKIRLRHILGISILHLCAKIQKIPMVQSPEKLVTNEGTGVIYKTSRKVQKTKSSSNLEHTLYSRTNSCYFKI